MSYGIVRVQKVHKTGVRGMQSHNFREKESKTNPDIDYSKSYENYALKLAESFNQEVNNRLDNLDTKKAIRKDAVVMVEILVTSDKSFFDKLSKEEQKKFFQDSLDFIESHFGKDNVFSAIIHMDEKTPHMHVDLVPIKNGRLTAKEMFNKNSLGKLHDNYYNEVGKKYNLERGKNRGEKVFHLETKDFKIMMENKKREIEIENKKEELKQQEIFLNEYKNDIKEMEDTLDEKTQSIMKILDTPKISCIEPKDVEYRLLKETVFFKYFETSEDVSKRLNDKYSNFAHDYIVSANRYKEKYDNASCEIRKMKENIKELQEKLDKYEKSLTPKEQKEVFLKAEAFRLIKKINLEKQKELEKIEKILFDSYEGILPITRKHMTKSELERWKNASEEGKKEIENSAHMRIKENEIQKKRERSRERDDGWEL